jgi:nicotinate-nucleotide adenylyltransferase
VWPEKTDDGVSARLGVLGGTFDPPHLGHLALARHALQELALDRVLLMPAWRPPHKPHLAEDGPGLHAGAHARLQMCRLLVEGEPRILVSEHELRREGPSYTVDTLRALHDAHPRASLTFILGADVARTLPSWREPRELLALARLAIAVRSGAATREVGAAVAALLPATPPRARVGVCARAGVRAHEGERPPHEGERAVRAEDGCEDRVRFLSMPALDISSSLVRERVGRGEPIGEIVGPTVAAYIDAHRLYRARGAEAPVS